MNFDLCVIDWTALGVVATTALAIVAVWQGRKANEMNLRLLAIEENERTPYLQILENECKVFIKDNNRIRIELCVKNITDYPIHNIKLFTKNRMKHIVIKTLKNLQKQLSHIKN